MQSQPLIESLDRLAAEVMAIDATDLQALAAAHSRLEQFEKLADEAADLDFAALQQIEKQSEQAKKLFEKIILHEVDDAAQGLSEVLVAIGNLQKVLNGTAPAEATPSDAPSDSAAPTAAPSPAPADKAERVLTDEDQPLVVEFIAEANTHLETAEQELLKLEDDPGNKESISALFRAFHTIKGVAGFLNFEQIQRLAHAAESLLDRGREGTLQITGDASQLVLESIDLMKALIGAVNTAMNARGPLANQPGVPELIKRLERFVESGGTDAGTPAAPAPAARREAEHAETAPATSAPTSANESPAESARPQAAATAAHATTTAETTVKVGTDRLDKLIDMVGELVIANSMVSQDCENYSTGDQRLSRHVSEMAKIVRELQDLSMSLRMVPVGAVLRKMTRLVRDVARKAGKEVELHIEGEQTELDRNVVEALGDPLVHMVRNSVDHGIEPPDVREANGKPRVGRVDLKAYHKGGFIHIEIADDGRGLNKDRILKKAIDNGLVAPDAQLTEQEIFRLIFAAGLSTAEKVTDISGRGVGMDVVKRNIEALRGRVDIQSTPGKGSVFTIRLPLTLAVIDGLVVKVGASKFILPITSIEQSIRPTPDMLSTVQGRGELCLVRGALLPIVRLHSLFNVEPRTTDPTQALVVIVQDNDRRVCVLVDELLGQQQVVIKSLGDSFGQLAGISGGAVLGDGNVSLIVDVPGLIGLAAQ
jgi:two-component system chemotaxis sensor kinase CheA